MRANFLEESKYIPLQTHCSCLIVATFQIGWNSCTLLTRNFKDFPLVQFLNFDLPQPGKLIALPP